MMLRRESDMKKRLMLWLVALALIVPAGMWAQGTASFSGTWKLDKVDPPLPTGRGGRGGGEGGNSYEENAFSPAPTRLVITQTPTEVTVQTGSTKAVYKLDNSLTVTPVGDINALKTWAHWDGSKLHLHQKQGMSFARDILSVSGGALTVVLDLESGGGSTTRTLTYTKATS
jgi:hypothetical protein